MTASLFSASHEDIAYSVARQSSLPESLVLEPAEPVTHHGFSLEGIEQGGGTLRFTYRGSLSEATASGSFFEGAGVSLALVLGLDAWPHLAIHDPYAPDADQWFYIPLDQGPESGIAFQLEWSPGANWVSILVDGYVLVEKLATSSSEHRELAHFFGDSQALVTLDDLHWTPAVSVPEPRPEPTPDERFAPAQRLGDFSLPES